MSHPACRRREHEDTSQEPSEKPRAAAGGGGGGAGSQGSERQHAAFHYTENKRSTLVQNKRKGFGWNPHPSHPFQ